MVKFRAAAFSSGKGRLIAAYIIGAGGLLATYSWRLASDTSGLSPAEVSSRGADKLSVAFHRPLSLPYKLIEDVLFHVDHHHLLQLRLGSALVAVLLSLLFFYILSGWFGKPIAAFSALLLSFTPMYMLAARSATPVIANLSLILVLFGFYLIGRSQRRHLSWLVFIVGLVFCLYQPGLIWFLLFTALAFRRTLLGLATKLQRKVLAAYVVLFIALLVPLLYGFYSHHDLIKGWLLLPNTWPGPLAVLKNFVWAALSIFGYNHQLSLLNIGHLPLLNLTQIGLLVFGAYAMLSRLTKILYYSVGILVLNLALAAINNNYQLMLISLPVLIFMCGMGLRFLFIEWRSVFPVNPIAKIFALSLMAVLIAAHIFFGVRASLIAWPATPVVRQAYVLK